MRLEASWVFSPRAMRAFLPGVIVARPAVRAVKLMSPSAVAARRRRRRDRARKEGERDRDGVVACVGEHILCSISGAAQWLAGFPFSSLPTGISQTLRDSGLRRTLSGQWHSTSASGKWVSGKWDLCTGVCWAGNLL